MHLIIKETREKESGECVKSSGLNGHAVIEGVMIKNKDQYAIAIRKPNQEIIVEQKEYKSLLKRKQIFRLPIIRGIITFAESVILEMKALTYSAGIYDAEEIKLQKNEESKKDGKGILGGILTIFYMVAAITAAVGIFMILPWFLADLLSGYIQNAVLQALVEGVLRLAVFLFYIVGTSKIKDVKRVYMYHGAEHKTINCIENGYELTVENVKRQSRKQKRCKTSFLLYVMVLSILLFMVVRVDNSMLRVLFRILIIPATAGVSYELIALSRRSNSIFIRLFRMPLSFMQRLIIKEPDNKMIEVAIQAAEAVFDWQAYQRSQIKVSKRAKESKIGSRALQTAARKEKIKQTFLQEEETEQETTAQNTEEIVRNTETIARNTEAIAGDEEAMARNTKAMTQNIAAMEQNAATMEQAEAELINVPEKKAVLKANRSNREETRKRKSHRSGHTVSSAVAAKKTDRVRTPLPVIEETRSNYPIVEEESDEILDALDKFFMDENKK